MRVVRRKACGFTLLEVMVAVSLLGVLLVLLFSAMRTGIRSWQAAERQIEAVEVAGQAERFLVRVIGEALSAGPGGTGGLSQVRRVPGGLFAGSGDRIALIAPGVRALPRPGLYRYEVYLEERAGENVIGDLWVRLSPYRPADDQASGEPRLLLENVAAFEIRYFGQDDSGGEPGWVSEWPPRGTSGSERLPLLVEIRLQRADGPARPPLIVAPMAAVQDA